MELLFVAMAGDRMGEASLAELQRRAYQTQLLTDGEKSPEGSIAVFTPLAKSGRRGKWLLCSAIKINQIVKVPEWVTTPFRVAVLKMGDRDTTYGFDVAIGNMARDYRVWTPDLRTVPWAAYEKDPTITPTSSCVARAQAWRQEVLGLNIVIRRVQEPEEPKDYRTVPVNSWSVNVTDQLRVFPDHAVEQGLRLLRGWQSSFRLENTWSRRELGTPSLVVRLDCTIHDRHLTVYEVEERPSGMGVTLMTNPFFKDRLGGILKTWPDFQVIVSGERAGTDDHIWMEALNRPIIPDAELVLVRAEPEETNFHYLEERSVSSLVAKGDKTYGESLGLWRRVGWLDDLPWDRGFVLKPKQGSKMHDVEIWDPLHRPGGVVKKSRIEAAIKRHGSMFLQQLVDPMRTGNPKFEWMIYRVYFGFNTNTSSWECLGGNWNARSNLRIHGASDALFGPLVME